MSTPAARAESIFATTSGIRPQFFFPAVLRCHTSTGIPASRPIRMASSSAGRISSLSFLRCVA